MVASGASLAEGRLESRLVFGPRLLLGTQQRLQVLCTALGVAHPAAKIHGPALHLGQARGFAEVFPQLQGFVRGVKVWVVLGDRPARGSNFFETPPAVVHAHHQPGESGTGIIKPWIAYDRHMQSANYLYLDGHAVTMSWAITALNIYPDNVVLTQDGTSSY
jgi:prepilin-type processing-associated H-X9-DG protein